MYTHAYTHIQELKKRLHLSQKRMEMDSHAPFSSPHQSISPHQRKSSIRNMSKLYDDTFDQSSGSRTSPPRRSTGSPLSNAPVCNTRANIPAMSPRPGVNSGSPGFVFTGSRSPGSRSKPASSPLLAGVLSPRHAVVPALLAPKSRLYSPLRRDVPLGAKKDGGEGAGMFVCVCVCVYVHVGVYIYSFICVCIYVCVHMHACMYARTHVCTYTCTQSKTHTNAYTQA